MIELQGKYNKAKVFNDNVESSAQGQILALCNQEAYKDSTIRVMPDVHAGKGCTIGTTMQIKDKICPNLVGVDIGCGVVVIELKEKRIDLPKFDSVVNTVIPTGRDRRDKTHKYCRDWNIEELKCYSKVKNDYTRIQQSIGTLGNGNHFIEIDKDEEGTLYLLIHTGSRNLGQKVAKHYQNLAYKQTKETGNREIPYELAYLSGSLFDDYMNDMRIVQQYADLNRNAIANVLVKEMNLHIVDEFTTVHNYIDITNMILRKGAVSALKSEILIIPMNMRDGSLICIGKGNKDWNY